MISKNPLLSYISKTLHVPIVEYNKDHILAVYNENRELADTLDLNHLNHAIFLTNSYQPCPYICQSKDQVLLTYIFGKHSNILIGPCMAESNFSMTHTLPFDCNLTTNLLSQTQLDKLVELSCLLFNCVNSDNVTTHECLTYNLVTSLDLTKYNMTDQYFQGQENRLKHNSYFQEIREFTSIEEGNLLKLQESWNEDYGGEVGTLADDELRSFKNLGIVIITLASRAAMRGGLNPEISYTLSDQLIKEVEKLSSPSDIQQFIRQTEIEYTLLVRQHKNETKQTRIIDSTSEINFSHPLVKKAQQYIGLHLHQQIGTPDIAESLNCSVSYLASLFKSELNLTIQNYIITEKIHYAELLLTYSDKTIDEIATSLGFCNQSYFGKIFKKHTQYTPLKFRQKFGK
ncbi:helix-turn-helix domain-containing protein [Streptococcus caprae]|uniref:Helix-turn-helix domain-containing protein n=1 Tax=Streptococcus caprae TaxID=1640501 RepID=A0ABV8CUY7_9STRE